MSYERPGFNPLSQEGPFPIEKILVEDFPVHFVDLDKLLKKTTQEEVVLVDSEFPTASYANHVQTKVTPGKNLKGEDALLYETAIQLEKGTASPMRFGHHFQYHMDAQETPRGRIRIFADPNLQDVRFLTDWNFAGFDDVVICDTQTDRLLAYNQHEILPPLGENRNNFYPTHTVEPGKEWSNHRRILSAPSNELIDPRQQMLFHLGSLIITAKVASAMGSYREVKGLKLDDFIITPNGPLYRNPDTGEYVHSLKPQSITIGKVGAEKETSQESEKSEGVGESKETAVTFDTLYGIDDIKEQLAAVMLYYKHPEIAKKWYTSRPSGILLKGPAGAGKTSIIKALAHEIGAEVRTIDASDIYNKYIGESERRMKSIFNDVRNVTKPTILFFDEIEGIVSSTDSTEGASLSVNAVAAIFKTETDRIAKENPNVLFAAATNYPERIDATLVRSGRFDVKITVGLPNAEARKQIFAGSILEGIMANRPAVEPEDFIDKKTAADQFSPFSTDLLDATSLTKLAEMSEDMSGADIRNILQRSLLKKALAEAKGQNVEPVSLTDLQAEIAAMRRS